VRHLVDEGDIGPSGEHRVEIHVVEFCTAVLDPAARDDLEAIEELTRTFASVGLDHADDDVGPALDPASALLEHLEGLADARRGAEIHPQASARR
jgi:hypothetical protein